jgi:hypothetical protein
MPSARAQRQIPINLWSLLWLLLVSPSLLAQAPPSADTFVSSAFSKTNFGSVGTMNVGPGSTSYVQFNLSGIPPGATVTKATLRLYVDLVISNGTFDVYQVNKSWSESALTYNNQPLPLGTSATGGHPVSVTSSSFNQFLLLDVTSLVQGWVGGTVPNYGVALALPSGSAANFYLDSKESLLTANGPELEIALAGAVGPPGPIGLTGATGTTGAQGLQGLQGTTGPTGPIGPAGTQGPQGTPGLTGSTGAQGPQGPQGTAGMGFNWRGAFDCSASYSAGDAISYQGSSWITNTPIGGCVQPPFSPWDLLAQQGAAGASGPSGPAGITGATGAAGAQGPQGVPGAQGPTGPVGINNRGAWSASNSYNPNDAVTDQGSYWLALAPSSNSEPALANSNWQQLVAAASLTSFDNLNGIPCSINGTTGATALSFSTSNGALTLTCNVPQFTAHSLGSLNCGNTASESGSLSPGTSQWFVVNSTLIGGCSQLKLTLTIGGSIVFDVQNAALSNVVTGVPNASLTTAGTYYIRIYGTDPSVTGNWTLALAEQ